MSLAMANALFFCCPFFVSILAVIFLKEKVGIRRWLAIATGFLGVFIVLDPDFSNFDYMKLAPIACAPACRPMRVCATDNLCLCTRFCDVPRSLRPKATGLTSTLHKQRAQQSARKYYRHFAQYAKLRICLRAKRCAMHFLRKSKAHQARHLKAAIMHLHNKTSFSSETCQCSRPPRKANALESHSVRSIFSHARTYRRSYRAISSAAGSACCFPCERPERHVPTATRRHSRCPPYCPSSIALPSVKQTTRLFAVKILAENIRRASRRTALLLSVK